MRKREDGYCVISNKTAADFHLRRDQYHTTRLALTKGVQFVDVVGFYGERATIKLDEVAGIFDMAPEVIQACISDERENESDDSLTGVG